MPWINVRLPGLLARFTGGRRSVEVRAGTVAGSLDRLLDAHPALEPHLCGADGELRPHLQVFRNGTSVAADADIPLDPGDEIEVVQAVSGG